MHPLLWFDDNAEEAAAYYTSIFENSRIIRITRYGSEGFEFHERPEGSVTTVEFEIDGQAYSTKRRPDVHPHRSDFVSSTLRHA